MVMVAVGKAMVALGIGVNVGVKLGASVALGGAVNVGAAGVNVG